MELSPEERERIEAEERARYVIRQQIEAEEREREVQERLAAVDPDRHSFGWTIAMVLGLFVVFSSVATIWTSFFGSPLRWWAS